MKKQLILVIGLITLAIFSRWIPHPPNMTALSAVALFTAHHLNHKYGGLIALMTALLISDMTLGFYSGMWFVYAAFVLVFFVGQLILKSFSPTKLFAASVTSSLLFFVITNLGVWVSGQLYPMNVVGFVECFVMAIPFLKNQLIGDLFYSAVLFGSFAYYQKTAQSQA